MRPVRSLTSPLLAKIMHGYFLGGVPERSKGSDCKSDGSAFGGSNPPPSTIRIIPLVALHDGGFRYRSRV